MIAVVRDQIRRASHPFKAQIRPLSGADTERFFTRFANLAETFYTAPLREMTFTRVYLEMMKAGYACGFWFSSELMLPAKALTTAPQTCLGPYSPPTGALARGRSWMRPEWRQTVETTVGSPADRITETRRDDAGKDYSLSLQERKAVLSASGIAKSYARGVWPRRRSLNVLRGADLVLRPGEIVGLVGENGSGKSTLMKILVRSIDQDAGVVRRSGSLGYCPQDPILYERLTCDEHFQLFGRAYGMTAIDVANAANDIYSTLGFNDWRDARVEELSRRHQGQAQSGARAAPRSGRAPPGRAVCGIRLGDVPAVLEADEGAAGCGTCAAHHQPLHHRWRALRPDLRPGRR